MKTVVGVLLNLLGTLAGASSAFIIQTHPKTAYAIMACGAMLEVTSMNFAPLSLLSPMAALVVLWTVVLTAVRDDPPRSVMFRYWAYGASTTIGCGLVVAYGPQHLDTFTLDEKMTHITIMFTVGIATCLLTFFALFVSPVKPPTWCEAAMPGVVAGFTNTSLKTLIESIKEGQATYTVEIAIITACFAWSQLYLLQNALINNTTTLKVNGVYIVCLIATVVAVSGWTFDEFAKVSQEESFACGIGMMFAGTGVFQLSRVKTPRVVAAKTVSTTKRVRFTDDFV